MYNNNHIYIKHCCYYNHLLYRAKHPVKVHVWAGISKKGGAPICIFDGTMHAVLFTSILDSATIPEERFS